MKALGLLFGLAALAAAWSVYRTPQADLLMTGLNFCQ